MKGLETVGALAGAGVVAWAFWHWRGSEFIPRTVAKAKPKSTGSSACAAFERCTKAKAPGGGVLMSGLALAACGKHMTDACQKEQVVKFGSKYANDLTKYLQTVTL